MESQILRCPEVVKLTGLSKATLYRAVHAGEFPRPVRLSKRAIGWRKESIQRWLETREPVDLSSTSPEE